ncbi:glutathione S-transferase N-terminal domain-containing protein [Photobacterium sp. SDRW27]|uniref:glutathione S-transferase N-terminal domain-containing protein n=1 Tax=Photobacterium obscurum TaxID=2829490 RepID=UPI002243DBDA|nr:glutathione S-transferase N-terminal domain-containing protein [Photobacterium obscurum]MCW8328918.1 glutathione S-transferase N-terminal domain-containing protein [Photobacterium obscurum]
MNHLLDITTSTLASTYRFWRGTTASKTIAQPEEMLILFDQEGCPKCRLVREVLTELNLDVVIAPCPVGGQNLTKFHSAFDNINPPMLVDLNGSNITKGAEDIIHYLFSQYKAQQPPKACLGKLRSALTSNLATGIRLGAGIKAKPSKQPALPLILFSFESSPFSRPVRERLCELELTYILVNLGKQQFSDMGPASFHWSLTAYKPLPNTKRDEFFKQHGNVQVPYLIDPNTDTEMFESKDILQYLTGTYGV